MKKLAVFLFLVACTFLAYTASALDVPPRPDDYISDRAGIFEPRTKSYLNRALAKFESETSNQIFVATFPSLEGESLEDFSIRLAEKWKIGQKGLDNGVIVLIFLDDRKMRIEVGYGLEGVLPDALAGQVIRNAMAPSFAKGNYEEGILKGIANIMSIISAEKHPGREKRVTGPDIVLTSEDIWRIIAFSLVFLILLFIITTAVDIRRYKSYRYDHRIFKEVDSFPRWWIRSSSFLFILLGAMKIALEIAYYMFILALFRGGGFGMGGSGGRRGGFGGGGTFGGGGASGGW